MNQILRRSLRPVLMLLLTVGLLLAGATALWGHALLQASSPEEGENLPELPAKVSLSFYEEISAPAYVVLNAPDGTNLSRGEVEVSGMLLSQEVQASDQEGTFVLAYRAVSADGHPIIGQITFTVGETNTLAALKARTEGTQESSWGGIESILSTVSTWFSTHRNVLIAVGLFTLSAVLYLLSRPPKKQSGA